MKKRFLSIALVLCMLLSVLPLTPVFAAETGKKISDYSVGEALAFGYYPQSQVTNNDLISALNTKAGVDNENISSSTASWTSYGYYSSDTDIWYDGEMSASDYMRYKDVVLGTNKYRGVVFDKYRPKYTGQTSSAPNSYQYDNGYTPGSVYWFKYEPITWQVLDPAKGLVISTTILDSQAFNNYIVVDSAEYYGETDKDGKKYFVNNYEHSSIREWLIDDFYNTAFSVSQQDMIVGNSETFNDKIYLLSYNEAINASYGFGNDEARKAQGSDYAKSQGLFVSTDRSHSGNSSWRLRSAGKKSNVTSSALVSGGVYNSYDTYHTYFGVRPAMNFSTNVAPVFSGIENGKTYCEAQTVTVSGIFDVTVNGTPITLDANGQFTLSPASGTQTVVATDKAGNVSAEMIVTVNDGHEGGTATCTKKAICKHCSLEYGEVDNNNHSNLNHIEAKAATTEAEGNIEYWHCEDCNKDFSDKDCKNEITLADTVIAKLSDSKAPQTGDNSHMALWFALLFVSGGLLTVTGVYGKKKYSAK